MQAAPLRLKPAEPKYWTSRAPYFTSWVAEELPRVLSPEDLEVGGLTIRTSLNMAWQDRAQATINRHAPGAMEGAIVSMEPGTGLSANPYFAFPLTVPAGGGMLTIEWRDDHGRSGRVQQALPLER